LQQPVVDEAYVANQPVRFRQRVDTVHDEADEAVALAAHAIHGRLAVYPHPLDADAKRVGVARGMRGFRRRDQQFRRHAPHSCTRRAVFTAFDDHGRAAFGFGAAVVRQPGRACADNGDVCTNGAHGDLSCRGWVRELRVT
jgi:hypothetical protein